jgi:hypothetical protein
MDLKVQKFVMNLPAGKRELALQVRDIFLSVDGVTEAIKWNQLTFIIGKANFAFIYTYPQTDYINVGFFKATQLSDPKKLFEGTGKGMRHIKIATAKDIPATQVKKWVKEAVKLEEKYM